MTTLADAMADGARERGFTVLGSRCFPLDADLAFAPVVHALGQWLREVDDDARRRLVRGLFPLGRLLVAIGLTPPQPLANAALEKTRLLEAIALLLERAAEPHRRRFDEASAALATGEEALRKYMEDRHLRIGFEAVRARLAIEMGDEAPLRRFTSEFPRTDTLVTDEWTRVEAFLEGGGTSRVHCPPGSWRWPGSRVGE